MRLVESNQYFKLNPLSVDAFRFPSTWAITISAWVVLCGLVWLALEAEERAVFDSQGDTLAHSFFSRRRWGRSSGDGDGCSMYA